MLAHARPCSGRVRDGTWPGCSIEWWSALRIPDTHYKPRLPSLGVARVRYEELQHRQLRLLVSRLAVFIRPFALSERAVDHSPR